MSTLGWGNTKNEIDTVLLPREPCTHKPGHLTTPGTQVDRMGEVPQNHTWREEWPEMSPVSTLSGEIPIFHGRLGPLPRLLAVEGSGVHGGWDLQPECRLFLASSHFCFSPVSFSPAQKCAPHLQKQELEPSLEATHISIPFPGFLFYISSSTDRPVLRLCCSPPMFSSGLSHLTSSLQTSLVKVPRMSLLPKPLEIFILFFLKLGL